MMPGSLSFGRYKGMPLSEVPFEPGEVAVARRVVEAGRRSLARVHHPDRAEHTADMQVVNNVADKLLEVLR
jgi:hypothetical protein